MLSNLQENDLEGLYYKITPCKDASILAVVFATVSVKPGRFSFYKNMEKQSVHCLYVNDPNNGWYQTGIPGLGNSVDETINTILKLKEQLGAKEIVTIGSSMGGYGAILYGAKIGSRVLAFGAETKLKTPGSRSLRYMPKNAPINYDDLVPHIRDSNSHVTLISGEADLVDLVSAERLHGLQNVNIKTIRGESHGVPALLDRKYGIENIFSEYLMENTLPKFSEAGNLCSTENAVELLVRAVNAISSRDFVNAKSILIELVKLSPMLDIAYHKLGIVEYQLGNAELSREYQEKAIEISDHFTNAHQQLGIALRKLGKYEESYKSHKKAYELDKNFTSAYYHAGLSLECMNRMDEAECEFKKAILKDSNNKKYAIKYAEILRVNAIRRIKESEEILKKMIVIT